MKVFGVDYQFLSCGDVFTQGLVHAAQQLGLEYAHAAWDDRPLERARAFGADLLFVVHGRRFSKAHRLETLLQGRTALWLLDEPYEVDNTAAFSRDFDHVFVNDAATLPRHPRSAYLPVCYDPFVHGPDWRSDRVLRPVGFVGGANPVRNRYLSALADAGLLTYVVGGPFVPAVQRLSQGHNIPAQSTAALYGRTTMVVNIFRSQHHYNVTRTPATAANPRIYEATACGALVVSEWRPELDTLCPELPTFRTVEECVDLVAALVADPARVVALQAACAARLAPHTYAARLQTVLQTCGLAVAA